MGTHISKVKSIDLDTWTPEQMEVCRTCLLTPFSFVNMQDRTFRSGAIALLIYTGKHISNLGTSHLISESIYPWYSKPYDLT